VSTEPTQDTTVESRSEAPQDIDTLGLGEDIRDGIWLDPKWWGFHLNFNHACVRALVSLGG
jgi:hypothetical protein